VKDQTTLGYDQARPVIFEDVDNEGGWVECVYTGKRVQTTGVPPSDVMNTEHSWPQSKGASAEPARGDLNHLYPVDSGANSRRSNNDYGWVVNATWTAGGSKSGADAKGNVVFEPRDPHKGNAARSIFYFSIRYRMPVPQDEEEALKVWNHLDPPDEKERARNTKIEGYQHTRNPFVDHPEFVDRIADF
jgi:endonuclease I